MDLEWSWDWGIFRGALKDESGLGTLKLSWIPAFAGMTGRVGVTVIPAADGGLRD